MRAIPAILVILAAAVASLPPGWCRTLPESPACCDACHEEHEHSDKQSGNEACQCNTLVLKQVEEAPVLPQMDATATTLQLEESETASLPVETDDRPRPNYQRTLCRWRC